MVVSRQQNRKDIVVNRHTQTHLSNSSFQGDPATTAADTAAEVSQYSVNLSSSAMPECRVFLLARSSTRAVNTLNRRFNRLTGYKAHENPFRLPLLSSDLSTVSSLPFVQNTRAAGHSDNRRIDGIRHRRSCDKVLTFSLEFCEFDP